MSWSKYLSLFSASTVKFMFAPLAGVPFGLSFIETYLSCIAGAISTATVFFFTSEYFILRAQRRRQEKLERALKNGAEVSTKRNFTIVNKLIVKTRKTFGIYGICLFAPLFLSIPGGTIVSAKFYGYDKRAFPLIVFGISLNGFIITTIVYSSASFI